MKTDVRRRLRSLAILAAMAGTVLTSSISSADPPICQYSADCYYRCVNDCYGGSSTCLADCVDTYCRYCP
jgi:hypothetical protein